MIASLELSSGYRGLALSAGRLFKFDCRRIAVVVKWAPTNAVNLRENPTQYLRID